jgi:pyruvate/2-oxoglutarate dehydrogenase complex dihydrolipoamide acyltransferase (E2) component
MTGMEKRSKLALLWQQLWLPHDPAIELHIRPERNFVLDILAEGRRKNTIYLITEAQVSNLQRLSIEYRQQGTKASFTCLIAKAFTLALKEQPEMQSYLKGKKTRVIFKNIDLACMVERELADGSLQPLHYIIRDCEQKTIHELQLELEKAKNAPIGEGGPLSPLEAWFQHWPSWCRKLVWIWIRHDPYTSKQLMGTAGLTSMGMFANDGTIVLPISPLTITLSIGGITTKPSLIDGQIMNQQYVQLALAANHDVIDGGPLTRFANRLKEKIELAQLD